MSKIIEFLNENPLIVSLLVEIVLSLIVILITVLRKKVKINDVFEMVLTVLPGYIREAESKFSVGSEKYSYVFNRCIEHLVLLNGHSKESNIKEYATKIDVAIENILSTPSKKK